MKTILANETCSHCRCNNKGSFNETSHLGKRFICYACIGKRELTRMQEKHTAILYYDNNKLIKDPLVPLFFKIKDKVIKNSHIIFTFLVNKKRWQGIMYNGCDRVMCKKLPIDPRTVIA